MYLYMRENNINIQKTNLKILKIIWYIFTPFLFAFLVYSHEFPQNSDYIKSFFIVLIVNSIGNFFLSLYSEFLEDVESK